MQNQYYPATYDDEIITYEDAVEQGAEDEAILDSDFQHMHHLDQPFIDRQIICTTILNITALLACLYCLLSDQEIEGFITIIVILCTFIIFAVNIYLWYRCWSKVHEARQEYLGKLEFSKFVKDISTQELISDSPSRKGFFSLPSRSSNKAVFV
uniref:AA_permease domain-containing protein n=1 Tax=Rhabditophanes sp. KR3021 TaxID=114890 RepID=A0AC35UHF7_9BILA